jgi:alkanesulfonate monooxygenase
VAELLFPKLPIAPVPSAIAPSRYLSPIGEIMANDRVPTAAS